MVYEERTFSRARLTGVQSEEGRRTMMLPGVGTDTVFNKGGRVST